MVVVRLINAIIATSIYLLLTPLILLAILFRKEQEHEYPRRKKEEREEPPFSLESVERRELLRKCAGKSMATLPVRGVQSQVRSRELVSSVAKAKDTLLSGELRKAQRAERTDAGLRRIRSNHVCNRKTATRKERVS